MGYWDRFENQVLGYLGGHPPSLFNLLPRLIIWALVPLLSLVGFTFCLLGFPNLEELSQIHNLPGETKPYSRKPSMLDRIILAVLELLNLVIFSVPFLLIAGLVRIFGSKERSYFRSRRGILDVLESNSYLREAVFCWLSQNSTVDQKHLLNSVRGLKIEKIAFLLRARQLAPELPVTIHTLDFLRELDFYFPEVRAVLALVLECLNGNPPDVQFFDLIAKGETDFATARTLVLSAVVMSKSGDVAAFYQRLGQLGKQDEARLLELFSTPGTLALIERVLRPFSEEFLWDDVLALMKLSRLKEGEEVLGLFNSEKQGLWHLRFLSALVGTKTFETLCPPSSGTSELICGYQVPVPRARSVFGSLTGNAARVWSRIPPHQQRLVFILPPARVNAFLTGQDVQRVELCLGILAYFNGQAVSEKFNPEHFSRASLEHLQALNSLLLKLAGHVLYSYNFLEFLLGTRTSELSQLIASLDTGDRNFEQAVKVFFQKHGRSSAEELRAVNRLPGLEREAAAVAVAAPPKGLSALCRRPDAGAGAEQPGGASHDLSH